jgi:hypothetical protein
MHEGSFMMFVLEFPVLYEKLFGISAVVFSILLGIRGIAIQIFITVLVSVSPVLGTAIA